MLMLELTNIKIKAFPVKQYNVGSGNTYTVYLATAEDRKKYLETYEYSYTGAAYCKIDSSKVETIEDVEERKSRGW